MTDARQYQYVDQRPLHPAIKPFIEPEDNSWHLTNAFAYFTGRETELGDLADPLKMHQSNFISQSIIGLGGIGKSALAKTYAHRSLATNLYNFVVWMNASTHSILLLDFQQLATDFGLPVEQIQAFKQPQQLVAWVYKRLAAYPKVLLIFDDAQDKAMLQNKDQSDPAQKINFLPSNSCPASKHTLHWLVTTRNAHFDKKT